MVDRIRLAIGILLSLMFLAGVQTAYSAESSPSGIAVVVMHGKGGSPDRRVNDLARALEQAGFQVANLEMAWSHRRQYDVTMKESAAEISAALDAMRAKGAKKMFVAGHSQGGLNALLYGHDHAVDGVIAIAPGASHGAKSFRDGLGGLVGTARSMIDDGRGNETSEFADLEGSRGTFPITTTAARYFDWFNPDGPHDMGHAVKNVNSSVPVLFIAPTRDYATLKRNNPSHYRLLHRNEWNRFYEPEVDHMNAPYASADEIIKWIKDVSAR